MAIEQGPKPSEMIQSSFWDDDDMRELVEYFVSELGSRIQDMSAAWDQENSEQILVLAHQLNGAAPGYGFDGIGDAAGRLDIALKTISATDNLASTEYQFRDLLDQCRRAIVGLQTK